MLTTVVAVFTFYFLLKIYISVMQIGYVSHAKKQHPVLMDAASFLKAGNYVIAKERMNIISTFIEYTLFIFWISFGLSYIWQMLLDTGAYWNAIFSVWIFLAVGFVVGLPFEIYMTFKIDEKFGFNKTSKGLFIKDRMISSLLTLLISAGIVWIVHLIITSSHSWWLYTFAFLFVVIILMNILFPIVRALFFDKLSPVPEGELKERLGKLFSENGFSNQGLFVSDASKRDARLNAYFAGIGKQKRVVLFDTLIEKLSIEELEAVLGHELGHYNHGDIYKNIGMIGLMLFATLFVFGNVPQSFFDQIVVAPTSGVLMQLFLLLSPVLFFFMMPIMGRLSRHNEYAADEMGAKLGGQENLISALTKLVTENKSFPKSHPLYLFFYATHPPVLERFEAMGVKVDHDDLALGDTWSP